MWGATVTGPTAVAGESVDVATGCGGVFSHVDVAGVDPHRVVDDVVHDRVGVDPTAKTSVPVLLRVLGGKDRGAGVITAFHEFHEHGPAFIGSVEEPLIQDEDGEGRVLLDELRDSLGSVPGLSPCTSKVWHADHVGPVAVSAGRLGLR